MVATRKECGDLEMGRMTLAGVVDVRYFRSRPLDCLSGASRKGNLTRTSNNKHK